MNASQMGDQFSTQDEDPIFAQGLDNSRRACGRDLLCLNALIALVRAKCHSEIRQISVKEQRQANMNAQVVAQRPVLTCDAFLAAASE